MFILKQYQNNVSFQAELNDNDFLAMQVWMMHNVLVNEPIAIKNNNLEYVALSDKFIETFNKNKLDRSELSYNKLDLGELNSIETHNQEQRVIDNLVIQHSMYILKIDKNLSYFLMRKRPLINPTTNVVVGILIIARKIELWRLHKEYIKQLVKPVFSKREISKVSLSDQQRQIVFCMILGFHSRKEISEILSTITNENYNETRIKNSIKRIYDKFECNSTVELLNLICNTSIKIDLPIENVPEGNYVVEL